MKGVENGISLVGRYIEEAAGSLSKTVDNSLNKVYIGIANSYFGDTSDLNKVLAAITSDSRKHDALFRNFIADENAQQYPTGKKPETEIGVLPLLAALGVVAAAGVGTTVYSDDIQNAIEYIKLQAFGEPVVTVTGDSSALGLANLSPDPCEDTLSDACIKAVR
ncbi:hypothetical protein L6303_01565, partial [archaeon]|nr:hypothetical protein [archaeon]